jgi:hypothetical protein
MRRFQVVGKDGKKVGGCFNSLEEMGEWVRERYKGETVWDCVDVQTFAEWHALASVGNRFVCSGWFPLVPELALDAVCSAGVKPEDLIIYRKEFKFFEALHKGEKNIVLLKRRPVHVHIMKQGRKAVAS